VQAHPESNLKLPIPENLFWVAIFRYKKSGLTKFRSKEEVSGFYEKNATVL
jgi:hypothetical protein